MGVIDITEMYRRYSSTADVNYYDFIDSAVKYEVINNDSKNTPLYRLVLLDPTRLLEIIKQMFSLPDDDIIAHKILLELVISLFIYTGYIEEGDIRLFRNSIIEIDSSIDDEVKRNKKYPESIETIYSYIDSMVYEMDMELCDVLYNTLDNSTAELKRFKISNNDYLVSFLGWSRDEKTIGFIIS